MDSYCSRRDPNVSDSGNIRVGHAREALSDIISDNLEDNGTMGDTDISPAGPTTENHPVYISSVGSVPSKFRGVCLGDLFAVGGTFIIIVWVALWRLGILTY